MSDLIIKICKIDDIKKHPNADRLDIATIKGWKCIVGRNDYKKGDLVVYIPPDSVMPKDLIEKYNLEFLKKDGRIKTIKLRKHISQGLVLPNINNDKLGTDVAKQLGITKYIEPEPVYWKQGKLMTKRKSNPAFDKYTNINNIKNYNKIFKKGDEIVITEKIHGCLKSNTKILLENGKTETISNIVKKKLNVKVMSEKNGQIVPTKITHYYNHGKGKNWNKVYITRHTLKGDTKSQIICTDEHKFLTKNNQYKKIKDLNINDSVFLQQKVFDLPKHIKDVLIGKMLGDGSLSNNSIQFNHKKEHEEYIDFTLNNLSYLAGNKQKEQLSGHGIIMSRGRSKSDKSIELLFKNWFIKGKKTIPKIKLSPISLAFWYMDDGSLSHSQFQKDRALFATNGFNENSINNLLLALKELGLNGKKYYSSGWRIRLNHKDAYKMFHMIDQYIPDIMRYKLPQEMRKNNYRAYITNYKPTFKYILSEQLIMNITPLKNKFVKYDLETENHNYIANNIVVHNSNFRCGILPIHTNYKNPIKWLIANIKKLTGKTHEFVYGSHNVQLSQTGKAKGNFYGDDIYGQIAKDYNLKEKLEGMQKYVKYNESINEIIIYGEIFGQGIQDLEYGLSSSKDLVLFDIKINGEYVNWFLVKEISKYLDVNTVPELFVGKYTDKRMIKKYTDGKSKIAPNQIKEGCVIKMTNESNDSQIGRKILKSVSENYLLRKNATEFK